MSADEQIRLLREILKWIRFVGAKEVRGVLEGTLDSEQKRLVYHLSDGGRGAVEIGKAANISDRTVRRYWESWARLGIMEPMKVGGGERYKKSFELEDFGIEVPQVASTSGQVEKRSQPDADEEGGH